MTNLNAQLADIKTMVQNWPIVPEPVVIEKLVLNFDKPISDYLICKTGESCLDFCDS